MMSQFFTQLHCLILGVLVSTAILTNNHAKEFTIKTSDGIVKCVFWGNGSHTSTLGQRTHAQSGGTLGHTAKDTPMLLC